MGIELDKYDDYIARTIDPVCLPHGKPWSANPPHWAGRCMYCCLCFKVLNSLEEMKLLPDGMREDVCLACGETEANDPRAGIAADKLKGARNG